MLSDKLKYNTNFYFVFSWWGHTISVEMWPLTGQYSISWMRDELHGAVVKWQLTGPCHSWGSQSLAHHCGDLYSLSGQSLWNLWWTNLHRDKVFPLGKEQTAKSLGGPQSKYGCSGRKNLCPCQEWYDSSAFQSIASSLQTMPSFFPLAVDTEWSDTIKLHIQEMQQYTSNLLKLESLIPVLILI